MIDSREHLVVSPKTLRQINNPWTRKFENEGENREF